MKVVNFYREERGNNVGHTLSEILTWTNGALEMEHDWVQWVFPSNEASMLNGEAPVLTEDESKIFQADPELREKMKQSLVRFLDFLDMKLIQEGPPVIAAKDENVPWWLRQFNHNMLRVTRCMKSLRLCGLTEYATALYDCLRAYKDRVSPNTWSYWKDAIFEPLW